MRGRERREESVREKEVQCKREWKERREREGGIQRGRVS